MSDNTDSKTGAIAKNADSKQDIVKIYDRKHIGNIAENVDSKHNITRNSDRKFNIAKNEGRELFFQLKSEDELRVLVGEHSTDVKIELSSGLAEIYGTEMEPNKGYSLSPNSSIAIFTWHGCVIKVYGTPKSIYFVDRTSMILSVILHASLEARRVQAEAENKKGPVILVVGQNDIAKSTLCRLLLNYAVHMGRHPVFIDLDVGQNSISFPGTIGVLTVEKPADIVTGFDDQPMKVYQFGYRSAWQSIMPYTLLMERLNLNLQSDVTNQNVNTSGIIINGCDWSRCEITHHGYGTVFLAIKNFKVDVLCVLHEEPLYLELQRNMPSGVEIIFIPKMDGVVDRRWQDKSESRLARMHEYFYGRTNQLQPFTFEVKYSDIQVFKVISKSVERYTEFLGEVKENDVKLLPVQITCKLIDHILALSSADNVELGIMYMHVIGFICITDVDIERDTITVLSPKPGPLPKKILLMGDTRIKKCSK